MILSKENSTGAFSVTAFVLVALALFFYGSFLTHKLNLVTADLGRHLKNGETFFKDFAVPRTNFYSYVEPNFPVVNHHWGAGVIFYAIGRVAGFAGIEVFFVLVSLTTLFIFLMSAKGAAGIGVGSIIALLVTPLLAERTEIRPEAFSYLFCGIFLWALLRVRQGGWSMRRAFLILPFVELMWVNTHIYFFLGPALIGVFLIEALVSRPFRQNATGLAVLLLLTAVAAFVNPWGFKGALAPFTILENYGYRLIENQPVWFIEKLIRNPNFTIFKFVFGLLAVSFLMVWVICWWTRLKRQREMPERKEAVLLEGGGVVVTLLAVGFSAMAWLQIRNFALFGFFALPIFAVNFRSVLGLALERYRRGLNCAALALLGLMVLITLFGGLQAFFPYWREFGLGLEAGNSAAAEFFKRENLKGPIFNNYDIGGYLIYHLFPQERVFVDNRPEAYSVDFFQKTYIPMQESDESWREVDRRYNFNTIIFSHRDATPWGQNFLVSRIQDPQWAPVFADQQALILLRRNETNRITIEKSELPKEMFEVL